MSNPYYTNASAPPMATAIPFPIPPDTKSYPTASSMNAATSTAPPPPSLPNPEAASRQLNEDQISRLLEQGYTRGLATSLNQMKQVFALRIWIIDNSGSMQKTDGHRIVPTPDNSSVRMVPCSRWEEIQECVDYHIKMAGLIEAPTKFRLLNNPGAHVGPQQFAVAINESGSALRDVYEACDLMSKARPGGCTPLTAHILEIHNEISQMAPELMRTGKKVAIVIATDGLPTNEMGYGGEQYKREFVEALRMLEGLPVWVVVRLCTDEDDVVGFYNDLDEQLELSLEVLDDFCGEAQEVYKENPWLNYALPLHRMREMGFHDRVFDLLDEHALTKTELRDFCALLFGQFNFDGVPDPNIDWIGFSQEISRLLHNEKKQWNPMKKRLSPWVDVHKMNSRGQSCGVCNIQ